MRLLITLLFVLMLPLSYGHAQGAMSAEQRLALQIANLSLQNAQQAADLDAKNAQISMLQKQIDDLNKRLEEATKTKPVK